MTLRPCLACGEPATGSRCPDHQLTDTRTDRTHVAYANGSRWKRFSQRLRALVPFCEGCGSATGLSVDHLLPVSDYPELTYAEENCRVLCLPCNGRRGNRYTLADALAVLARLQATYRLRPTRQAAERVTVAERAVQAAPGGMPDADAGTDRNGRQSLRYTPPESVNR